MTLIGLAVAALVTLFGLRLILIATQTALSGKVMIRQGMHTRWQPVAAEEAWRTAFREGLMGLLLLILGIVLMI